MTLPKYEPLGGSWHRAWWDDGTYLDIENTRERSWPGLGAGDPPGEVHRPLYEDAARQVADKLGDNWWSLTDVGCGSGYGLPAMMREMRRLGLRGSKRCLGLDPDRQAVAFAWATYAEGMAEFDEDAGEWEPSWLNYYADSALRLGVAPEENSVIVCVEAIEHIHDDRAAASALFETLKPGGLLYLSTPEYVEGRAISQWHCREYTWDQISALLTEAGFVDLERHTVDAFRESIVLTGRRPE